MKNTRHVVDFSNVWLACNDELLARGHLSFAGLVTIGATAMAMYELFSWIERRTTGWVQRGTQGD